MRKTETNTAKRSAKGDTRPPASDLERLKDVTRKMLERLEGALEHAVAKSEKSDLFQQHYHERVFGAKTSLAEVLTMLADLFFKLEAQNLPTAEPVQSVEEEGVFEDFIRRIRGYDEQR